MIVRKDAMRVEERERMRGGEGTVSFHHFVGEGELPHLKAAAELSVPPGASIGKHGHSAETEYFVFLEGSGLANDNGSEVPVGKGDVMITGGGAFHGVTNTGSVPLVMVSFIIDN